MRKMRIIGGVAGVCGVAWALTVAASTMLSGQQTATAPLPSILQSYQPVTAERLKKPEDGDWLTVRRTYDGWGYSPLTQIGPGNVGRLQPVWVFATGERSGHQAPPMVNNGVMFVATPGNQRYAGALLSGKVPTSAIPGKDIGLFRRFAEAAHAQAPLSERMEEILAG